MLALGSVLVPPEGCSVVAVEEGGRAFAACIDPDTWFVYDPDLIRGGLWSKTSYEPPELTINSNIHCGSLPGSAQTSACKWCRWRVTKGDAIARRLPISP